MKVTGAERDPGVNQPADWVAALWTLGGPHSSEFLAVPPPPMSGPLGWLWLVSPAPSERGPFCRQLRADGGDEPEELGG